MTVDEALDWCRQRLATVSFHSVHGHPRVTIRVPGGFPTAERDTFVEAAEAVALIEDRVRLAARGEERHIDGDCLEGMSSRCSERSPTAAAE